MEDDLKNNRNRKRKRNKHNNFLIDEIELETQLGQIAVAIIIIMHIIRPMYIEIVNQDLIHDICQSQLVAVTIKSHSTITQCSHLVDEGEAA